MIKDALAVFADALEGTASAASTEYIDNLVAGGNAYEGAFLVIGVDTAYAGTGTITNTFQLQTSASSTFDDTSVTLIQSAAFTTTDLAVNKQYKYRIPADGMKRYLRVYKVSTNTPGNIFSAGKYDAFITLDVDVQNRLA